MFKFIKSSVTCENILAKNVALLNESIFIVKKKEIKYFLYFIFFTYSGLRRKF